MSFDFVWGGYELGDGTSCMRKEGADRAVEITM